MKRLITGIKPTGEVHLGNYFGVIRQLLQLQDEYDCYVFIADVHALNQIQDAKILRQNILEVAKVYLAAGLNPEKVCFFQQSALPHAELSAYLASFTSVGLLERSHAYKDAIANGKQVNAGLFFYPVLMAADILLYQAEIVPVGEDQKQHLEIAREIAGRFNHSLGKTFVLPEARIDATVPTVKGVDGRKMSKSYNNVIGLFDSPETISKKVARIVTDSKGPHEPKDPKTDTIFSLYQLVASTEEVAEMQSAYLSGGISYKEAKDKLASALIAFLAPIQARKAELDQDDEAVYEILRQGAKTARPVAEATLDDVKIKAGLL